MSGTGFPRDVIDTVNERSGELCEAALPGCEGRAVDIQHRRPRGMGGTAKRARAGLHTNCPCNAVAACRACHGWMESHAPEARVLGLAITQHETEPPSSLPVLLRGGVVLLGCDGSTSPASLIDLDEVDEAWVMSADHRDKEWT